MQLRMMIGGVPFRLDPAAISAIRYRAEHGTSILNDLVQCKSRLEEEGRLLRMCHCMIPEADRPELPEFARLARRGPAFFAKAQAARDALLKDDPRWHRGGGESAEEYDEYDVLAMMAAAHMDSGLIYELPILHLVGIVGRYFEAQDPNRVTYKPMDEIDMAKMYPR